MKPELCLLLRLIVVCGAIDMLVNLGQNATLKCDTYISEVYWFVRKPSEKSVFILRSFSERIRPAQYSNMTLNRTFSLRYNSSLFISKISVNELGVYYCVYHECGLPPKIGTGIRLYTQNQSTVSEMTCKDTSLGNNLILSVVLILLIIVTVVTFATICICKRSALAHSPNPGVQQSQDNSNVVYADVQFHTFSQRCSLN